MNRVITLVILAVIIAGLLFLPIKIPYTLESIGDVKPVEEWILLQDINGSLNASHRNNQTGVVENIASWQFERGDLYGMEVSIKPQAYDHILRGDTIVRMYSSLIAQQILDIENQLKVKTAQMQVLVTGEKTPIIEEAESKLRFAKEALSLRQKEYDIAKTLQDEGVNAPIDYTRALNALELARINITTAEKALVIAQTGVKSESSSLNTSESNALKKQLNFLKTKNTKYVIIAPFDGRVVPTLLPGEILRLQKIKECVVTVPVKTEEMTYTGHNPELFIQDAVNGHTYQAKIILKSNQTEILNGRSVSSILAIIHPQENEMITLGVSARCLLHCDELSPIKYLRRILNYNISGK